jgi:hypothetical protein
LAVLRSRGFFVGSSLSKFVELRNLGLVFHPMGQNISGKKKNTFTETKNLQQAAIGQRHHCQEFQS